MKKKQTAPGGMEITVEEVERQIRKLQKRKAPKRFGVQNEAWMYGTEGMGEVEEWLK
jgi:DNA-binding Lrp family transcriptional regulator